MRILIDARLYGLENAGLGRYVMNLVEELKKLGGNEEFTVFLRNKYFNKLDFKKNWKKVRVDIGHYTIEEQLRLPAIIKGYEPDIVHFPHFNVPLLYGGKYIVTIHDIIMHKSRGKKTTTLPFYKYWLKRVGYKIAFSRAINGSRKILVPSKTVKQQLLDQYSIDVNKVIVTYEGLDKKYLQSPTNVTEVLDKYAIKGKYFIYVGNAYPHKNLERIVEAIVKLNKEKSKAVKFVIVCSRSVFTRRIEDMIKRKSAAKYVKFLGFVSDKELVSLLNGSLGFVYASLDEGFGLQGLESMAAGTLVLASDIAIFKEIYKKNAIYFDPLSVEEIKETMKSVLMMPSKNREKLVKDGKRFVKTYSWEDMATKTLEVYRQFG